MIPQKPPKAVFPRASAQLSRRWEGSITPSVLTVGWGEVATHENTVVYDYFIIFI